MKIVGVPKPSLRPASSARTRMAWRLCCGALVLIAAAGLFGAIAENVSTGGSLTGLDLEVARWLHDRATPEATRWLFLVTELQSTVAISCYSVAIGIFLYARRDRRRLALLFVAIAGGLALNVAMKFAFHRARPVFEQPLLTLPTYSFPSGHVAATTIFYGLGVVWVFGRTRQVRWRLLATLAAAAAIVLVAFSRLYLGAHYLTDVVAAFAEGLAWLALCLSAFTAWWHAADPVPPDVPRARG